MIGFSEWIEVIVIVSR